MRSKQIFFQVFIIFTVFFLPFSNTGFAAEKKTIEKNKTEMPTPFINPAKDVLIESAALKPVDIEPGLSKIRVDGGSIDLEVYKSEKVGKAVFCDIRLFKTNVSEKAVMVWPAEGYDFPALWLNLTQMPGVNVAIFDFIPLMDIVVAEKYAETYLINLNKLSDKAFEIFADTVIDKAFKLDSLAVHALSPYKVVVMISDEGAERIPEIVGEYLTVYLDFIKTAQPVEDKKLLKLCSQRKDAVSRLLKANDPGYPFMINVFGKDKTEKVFDVVF